MREMVKLKYIADSFSSSLSMDSVLDEGFYEVYGASGFIGYKNDYKVNHKYIGIIKDGAGVGRVNIFEAKTNILGTMAYIYPKNSNNTGILFMKYAIDAMNLGKGDDDKTTIPHIYFSKYGNNKIYHPSLQEQQLIANFLDEKCNEIDSLTSDIQKQIETLQEYKKSVITEVVTKGLDKDAKMKDSGVPLIGEVPDGWKTPKLKNVAILTNGDRGKNNPSGNDLVDDGICFFTANNIHEQYLDCSSDKNKFITESRYNILGGAKIKLNDILFCLRGSTAGNAAINKTVNAGTIASSLVCITPQYINPDYLNYYLQSEMNAIQTSLFMNGSCAANLSAENVLNYYIIQPPTLEQQQIVSYLDSKCSEIDALLQNYENQIATLGEYKKSLIYEYVTGKKEVLE